MVQKKILEKTCPLIFLYFIYFSYTVLTDLQRDKKALRVTNVRSFLKQATVEEKRSPRIEVEKVHYVNKMATLLKNLQGKSFLYLHDYAIIQTS